MNLYETNSERLMRFFCVSSARKESGSNSILRFDYNPLFKVQLQCMTVAQFHLLTLGDTVYVYIYIHIYVYSLMGYIEERGWVQ